MVDVSDLKEDPLEKEGWQRRSILDEPRLSEAVKMYEELGFEVLVTEFDSELFDAPEGCFDCVDGQLKVVYTRPRKGEEKSENPSD